MKNQNILALRPLLISILIVLIIFVTNILLVPLQICNIDNSVNAGELFGISSALFAGLGFAGLIYTIILQRKQLHENSEEIRRSTQLSALTALLIGYNSISVYDPSFRGKRDELLIELQKILNENQT